MALHSHSAKYEDGNGNNSLFEFEYLIYVSLQNQTIASLVLNKVLADSSFCISASSSGYCIETPYTQLLPYKALGNTHSGNEQVASPSKQGSLTLFPSVPLINLYIFAYPLLSFPASSPPPTIQ
ncbi:hypothetical protein AVEN_114809-1 [Araneus ventricosus]|uniref:Uncharacterized protein n=1 Tax=Araneus ventricosus TaxID=182803 RepID=A0A4Y2BWK3_ARAVE|nr:hypothetical protein AVEN_114809-1 [Araneus ventricosus]